jgi:hypothetical protein
MKVRVIFHGELAEIAGAGQKYYYNVRSLGDLKLRIMDDFPRLVHTCHLLFLNDSKRSANARLKNNDKISLIPSEDL